MPMIVLEKVLRARIMEIYSNGWLMDVVEANIFPYMCDFPYTKYYLVYNIEIKIQNTNTPDFHPLHMHSTILEAYGEPWKPKWIHKIIRLTIKYNPTILKRAISKWISESKDSLKVLNAYSGDYLNRYWSLGGDR